MSLFPLILILLCFRKELAFDIPFLKFDTKQTFRLKNISIPHQQFVNALIIASGIFLLQDGKLVANADVRQDIYANQEISTIKGIEPRLGAKIEGNSKSNQPLRRIIEMNELIESRERVLTLKAYLDELERDLFRQDWDRFQDYIYAFSEQDDAFALLMEGLFPSDSDIDKAARDALIFEAKEMFVALDDLREASIEHRFKVII